MDNSIKLHTRQDVCASDASVNLETAMNTLRTILKMVHSTVFENDNPENIGVVAAIVESGLVWLERGLERGIQELATGWPDTVGYKPYGFCELTEAYKQAQEKAPGTPEQNTPEA
jgi:hypothetical protein